MCITFFPQFWTPCSLINTVMLTGKPSLYVAMDLVSLQWCCASSLQSTSTSSTFATESTSHWIWWRLNWNSCLFGSDKANLNDFEIEGGIQIYRGVALRGLYWVWRRRSGLHNTGDNSMWWGEIHPQSIMST
jgi:hypothetical protein